ncbi:hypothetical protein ACFYTG_47660 [Streptomyces mirabilis]|uniref:hypothetical protein n=1 Tax=Streptomyces mirabilis TaxID=68239 RepID=UPI0036C3566B
MLLCLAFLAAASALALLRLLPMSGRDKGIEILALRHLLLVLQCQVGRPVFAGTDRAVLAGLFHHFPAARLLASNDSIGPTGTSLLAPVIDLRGVT